ncbi:MAG: type II toxin-antitoxin system RelE/ParE family toxin [Alphaproteobacteria bacterium]|nr:type II toxin-antitoxin system RelE/ParE family toxin [Alphaproteobacteria bacterium]
MANKLRCFMVPTFAKWAKREGIDLVTLYNAAQNFGTSSGDVRLRQNLYKIRVAAPELNRGKSGGFRVIIAYQSGKDFFFLHGFRKSDEGNISQGDENVLSLLANELLTYDESQLKMALETGNIKELYSVS